MDLNLRVENRKRNLHKHGGATLCGEASPVKTSVENKMFFVNFIFYFCLSQREQAVLLCAFTVLNLRTLEQKRKQIQEIPFHRDNV